MRSPRESPQAPSRYRISKWLQAMSADFDRIRDEFGFAADDATVLKCFLLWAALVGAISLEVFGQYGADTLTDPAVVFDGQIGLLIETFSR